MKRGLSIICLICIGLTVIAQNNLCTIKGNVKDEKGRALEMANVVIKQLQKGSTTNAKGLFSIKNIKKGKYTLVVNYMGYETFSKDINLVKSTYTINIQLKKKRILTEDVIVRATRASYKTPVAFTNLGKENLEKVDIGKDIPYLLEQTPSVVATSEAGIGIGNTSIRVRGTDASRINITINGVPLNDSESHSVYWVNMPQFSNSVNNVQIQRGVGSSTNGAAAFGATINFQTTGISNAPYANVGFAAGSYNTFIRSINLGTGKYKNGLSFDARYSDLKSDGYINNSFSDHKSAYFSATYQGENTLIKGNIILGEQHTGISWWGTPKDMLKTNRKYNPAGVHFDEDGTEHYYKDQTDNYWQNHYQLMISHAINDMLNLNFAFHTTTGKGHYEQYKDKENPFANESMTFTYYGLNPVNIGGVIKENSDFIRQKHLDNIFYGITSSLIYTKGNSNLIIGGGINKYEGDHFGKVLWSEFNDGSIPKDFEWYRNYAEKTDGNIFVKLNQQVTDKLNIYADLQYRHIKYMMEGPDDDLVLLDQKHYYNFLNPKFGIFYDININSHFYASFAVANREPARADIKDASKKGGKDFPTEETLYDYEFGYKYRTEKLNIGVNLYYMDYKDQLVLTGEKNSVGYSIMTNVDDSYRAGIELSAAYKFCEKLLWSANTTLSRNRIKDYSEYVNFYDKDWNYLERKSVNYGSTHISYSPSVIVSSLIEFKPFSNTSINLNSKYVGKQYFDNTESDERSIDAYFINNIAFEYSFKIPKTKDIKLQLLVNNIFDIEYENNAYGGYDYVGGSASSWSYYFPQAGTNYMLKASINF